MWSVAYASMTFRTVDVGWVNFVFALLPCAFVMASPQMALAAEPSPDSDTVPAPAAAAGQPEVPPAPSYPPPPMAYPPPPTWIPSAARRWLSPAVSRVPASGRRGAGGAVRPSSLPPLAVQV